MPNFKFKTFDEWLEDNPEYDKEIVCRDCDGSGGEYIQNEWIDCYSCQGICFINIGYAEYVEQKYHDEERIKLYESASNNS